MFAVVLEERRGLGYVCAACTTRRGEFNRSLFLAVLAFYGGFSRSRSLPEVASAVGTDRGAMVWYGMVQGWNYWMGAEPGGERWCELLLWTVVL